jgi:hypothetical protein
LLKRTKQDYRQPCENEEQAGIEDHAKAEAEDWQACEYVCDPVIKVGKVGLSLRFSQI